mmetsp:Transcript_24584/g.56279  ORF Transcript_24584/g.56279 Transcript_24584/m.56279 type:complete len:344 (-) Transcript_24584:1553-2584(-)
MQPHRDSVPAAQNRVQMEVVGGQRLRPSQTEGPERGRRHGLLRVGVGGGHERGHHGVPQQSGPGSVERQGSETGGLGEGAGVRSQDKGGRWLRRCGSGLVHRRRDAEAGYELLGGGADVGAVEEVVDQTGRRAGFLGEAGGGQGRGGDEGGERVDIAEVGVEGVRVGGVGAQGGGGEAFFLAECGEMDGVHLQDRGRRRIGRFGQDGRGVSVRGVVRCGGGVGMVVGGEGPLSRQRFDGVGRLHGSQGKGLRLSHGGPRHAHPVGRRRCRVPVIGVPIPVHGRRHGGGPGDPGRRRHGGVPQNLGRDPRRQRPTARSPPCGTVGVDRWGRFRRISVAPGLFGP